MRPIILDYQEKVKNFLNVNTLGTETVTKTRENKDIDYDLNKSFLGTQTKTATRENTDTDFNPELI